MAISLNKIYFEFNLLFLFKYFLKMLNFYILLLSNISLILSMKFNFKMAPITMRCLGDYLVNKTLVIFTINANSKEIRARLFDVMGIQ